MPKVSAGVLLYRRLERELQVLLVHPGGPFWEKKDRGAWSIPKGLCEPREDHRSAAARELEEETGIVVCGELTPLGEFLQPSGKVVVAFALEQDFDPGTLRSNLCETEWPPHSGRTIDVPEVDQAEWYSLEVAQEKIVKGQAPILRAFMDILAR